MISEITRKLQLWEGDTGSVPVTGTVNITLPYLVYFVGMFEIL